MKPRRPKPSVDARVVVDRTRPRPRAPEDEVPTVVASPDVLLAFYNDEPTIVGPPHTLSRVRKPIARKLARPIPKADLAHVRGGFGPPAPAAAMVRPVTVIRPVPRAQPVRVSWLHIAILLIGLAGIGFGFGMWLFDPVSQVPP